MASGGTHPHAPRGWQGLWRSLRRSQILRRREERGLRREVAGLTEAVQLLVKLKALELGVPDPFTVQVEPFRADASVEAVDTAAGAYVEAERRRDAFEANGRRAPFDDDFMDGGGEGQPAHDQAVSRGRALGVFLYPEDQGRWSPVGQSGAPPLNGGGNSQ